MAGNESGQAVVEPVGHRPGGEEGFRTRGFRSVRSSRRFRGALLPRQACHVDAQPTSHTLGGLGRQPGGPQLGPLLQEEARLGGAVTTVLGHVENEPVEHLGRQLEFPDERDHLRILLLQRIRDGHGQPGHRKSRDAAITGSRVHQLGPAAGVVVGERDGHQVVLGHEAGGVPVIEEQGLAAGNGRGDLGIQRRTGAGMDVGVAFGKPGVGQQAGVEGLAGPAGRAVQEAGLAGLFRVGEQVGMAGQVVHRLQVGVLFLHVTGHVPALHGATGKRVAQDGDLLVGHGLLDAGRATNPLFGNDLDVVLDEGRLQTGHRAGHHLGAAAQALAQQQVQQRRGDLAAFPVQSAQADGGLGSTVGRRLRRRLRGGAGRSRHQGCDQGKQQGVQPDGQGRLLQGCGSAGVADQPQLPSIPHWVQ